MKRGAERQLVKGDPDDDDDDIEEIQDPQGFQQADESALAKRQIRALPKRALAASEPPPLNGLPPSHPDAEMVDPPKFVGFGGFGTAASAPSPFTFSAQPPRSSALPSHSSDTTLKLPSLASPISGAPKPFHLDADTTPPKPAPSPPADETHAVAFKYFKSLRGLNVSFVSAISAAVEKDPFFDVANLVESYKNLRTTIQSEFDESTQLFASRAPPTTTSNPLFGAAPPAKVTLFTMPKPPEAPLKSPSTGDSGIKTGGFTFPAFVPPPSSAPMSFGSTTRTSEMPSSTTPEPPKSAFTFTSKIPAATSSMLPISFAAPPSIENVTSNLVPPASPEAEATSSSRPAAPTFGSSSAPNFFAKPTSAFGASDAAFKPTSVFGSSIFGGSRMTGSDKPSPFAPPLSDSKDSLKTNATAFGGHTTSSSTSASIFGSSSDKPASFFGSATPPKTSAFTFGKPGGSIGNPVGFGFGGSSPGAGDTTIPGSSGSGFTFGAPPGKSSEGLFSPSPPDKSTESTPQPDGEGNEEEATKLLPSHAHDEEGEGEEDEETMHAVKCKVYRLSKSEDKSEWKDLGVGFFRLKKHKVTSVRRALMRNSHTGRILVNFRIYGGLKPSLAKTSISFIGYENNTPTSFRIRVKTEEQAGELKQAIEQEVAAVQAEH